ncbi:MAG: hypothetical protein ILP16_11155 [Spirochaetales bacterium]|nr:hypothetical protein [Spirochaetales bacterium]
MLRRLLKNRKADLQRLIRQCKSWVSTAPQGSLRISTSHRKTYYYHYTTNDAPNGKLLSPEKDASLIKSLASKDYYLRVISVAEKEIKAIDPLLKIKEDQALAKVFEKMRPERQELVHPVEKTREKELANWIAKPEPPSEPESGKYYIPTDRGELVRSKNEYLIANALYHAGIPYKYEYQYIAANGKIIHPDFYVRNPKTGFEYYWEHFGMMDDPDYVENSFMYKIKLYAKGGLIPGKNLIATFSDKEHELTEQEISDVITKFLK